MHPLSLTRRELLARVGMGMPMLGLAALLGETAQAAGPASDALALNPLAPRVPHFAPKAKRVIHLFMNGGPSQVDTFDPKPELQKHDGKPLPMDLRTERKTGAAFASPFKFDRYGECGMPISELFAHLGPHADDLCVIRSMKAERPNHEPSLMLMNSGDQLAIRPSMGSWVTYGLGTENQNLPGFIAMCPGGYPVKGAENWRNAFLPGAFQGTHIDTRHQEVEKLIENVRPNRLDLQTQRGLLDLVQGLNRQHAATRQQDPKLEARIQSFELAYRMQIEAADAFDLSKEPPAVHERYGKSVQARQLLLTRRLIERGVRFVQVWHGEGQPWDSHENIEKEHRRLAGECSQAIGALLTDLKERGLFDETLVIWGGEFGRTPSVELPMAGTVTRPTGRDHNHYGFTMWLAGGGAKGGYIHGATDDFGFAAVDKPVHVHDLHATVMHLLGFDHTKLTYHYAGRDFRLTDVHGEVIHDLIG